MIRAASSDSPASKGPYQGYLNDRCVTLAEVLKPAGYSTYMSGKWHVGEAPQHWPRKRGFDRYFGLISGASSYWRLRQEGKCTHTKPSGPRRPQPLALPCRPARWQTHRPAKGAAIEHVRQQLLLLRHATVAQR